MPSKTEEIEFIHYNAGLVIQFEKMTVNLYMSQNCMQIGHGSD